LAIDFRNNPFFRARLKLTAVYSAGVLALLVVFSLAIYSFFAKNITSNLEYDGQDQEESQNIELQVIQRAKDQLLAVLLTVDGLVIFLVAGMSYSLAGKTLRPIEASYKKQKKFMADAAHELRTPLAVMKTGAEALLMGRASEKEYEKFTRDFLEEINSLSALVNDLLFLVRGDSLKKIEFEKIDIGLIAKKQVELMRKYAKNKQVNLENEVNESFYIQGNKSDVKRLLANLIKNAIDYNRPDGKAVVSLSVEKNQVALKIADSGTGIAEKDLSHVFDRFYKVDAARTKTAGGSGLGLAIVKEIVNSHGGKIGIKSELGKGTEITIFFPSVFS